VRYRPALLLVTMTLGCTPAATQAPATDIRLVVHLSVDQLRPDYLERWQGELTGGLGRLLREGVVYLEAEQDHAITETAPGHASMLSGRWPASTGIISNDRGVPDRAYPLVGTGGGGASPARFTGTTLYDWMRSAYPEAQALSVSRKDRGAILPVGRAAASVFWWSSGRFTTSRWYGTTLPDWVTAWNAADPIERLRGTPWTPMPGITYPERDDRAFETGGREPSFPHRLPDDWTAAATAVTSFPVMDSLTLDVAWHGVRAMALGQGDHPDFLAVSLSTTDAVGHDFGPGSRELHDQIRRLDAQLGWFLDSLATAVPLDRVLLSLTSDHGVQEYPEAGQGGRLSMTDEARALDSLVRVRWSLDADVSLESGLLMVATDELRRRGVDVDSIAAAIAGRLRGQPGVRDVFTPSSLSRRADAEAMRWHRQLGPGAQWLVAVSLEPGWVFGSGARTTTHGTTNLLDRRVPLIIRAAGLVPRRVDRVVGVVDLAPTLAALLGIAPTEPLDGEVLPEVVPPRR
jgi:arylsulfatase A-like enzyme